jgi:hypothetical protein
MQSEYPANTREIEFLEWLKELKFLPYQQALEDEGYEELESLTLLTPEQIEELSVTIQMRPGHKVKFPVAIHKAREELQESREELEEVKAKRKKQKQEQQKEQELARELANIKRERKLFEAKARQLKVEDSKDPEDQNKAESSKTDKAQKRSTDLPAWKDFAAFISHKKMHTEFGDSSETLSIRLKVIHATLVLSL